MELGSASTTVPTVKYYLLYCLSTIQPRRVSEAHASRTYETPGRFLSRRAALGFPTRFNMESITRYGTSLIVLPVFNLHSTKPIYFERENPENENEKVSSSCFQESGGTGEAGSGRASPCWACPIRQPSPGLLELATRSWQWWAASSASGAWLDKGVRAITHGLLSPLYRLLPLGWQAITLGLKFQCRALLLLMTQPVRS